MQTGSDEKTALYIPPNQRRGAGEQRDQRFQGARCTINSTRELTSAGWNKSGAELFYPANGYPHLHLRFRNGENPTQGVVFFKFTFGGDRRNFTLFDDQGYFRRGFNEFEQWLHDHEDMGVNGWGRKIFAEADYVMRRIG